MKYKSFDDINESLNNNFKTHHVIKLLDDIFTESNKSIHDNKMDYVFLEYILTKLHNLFDIIGIVINSTNDTNDTNKCNYH